MSIPAWLERHLVATGVWDADGTSRNLRSRVCRCGARILRGHDADRAALATSVDPDPVDPAGELLALAQGRATFRIAYRNRWEINHRSSIDIAAQPAGNVDVLVEHKCGEPFPCNGPPIKPHRRVVETQSEEAPF